MKTIHVLCLNCRTHFEFRHPSINSAQALAKITIDCPSCDERITGSVYHLAMEPVKKPKLTAIFGDGKDATHDVKSGKSTPAPHLPNSPLSNNDELAAFRRKLSEKE